MGLESIEAEVSGACGEGVHMSTFKKKEPVNFKAVGQLRTGTRIWFGLFTFHTLALPAVGVIDVLNFHPVHGSVKTGADQLLITGCC